MTDGRQAEEAVHGGRSSRLTYVLPVPRFFSQANGIGGHVSHFLGITGGFARADYDVHVHGAERPQGEFAGSFHPLPMAGHTAFARLLWHWRLTRTVISNVKRSGAPVVYVRYSAAYALFIPTLKKGIGAARLVLEVNSLGAQRTLACKPVDIRCLGKADLVTVVSRPLLRHAHSLMHGERSARCLLVENGVDLDRYCGSKDDNRDKEAINVGYVGILKGGEEYGLRTMIGSFLDARDVNPKLRLHIYGDGPERQELEREYAGVAGVIFHGPVPRDAVPGILRGLAIAVNSNGSSHMNPTKLYEYMAAGKAIISAASEAADELLEHGAIGKLYQRGDRQGFARELLTLGADPALRGKLGELAACAVRAHSWDSRIRRILAALAAIDGGDTRPARFER